MRGGREVTGMRGRREVTGMMHAEEEESLVKLHTYKI